MGIGAAYLMMIFNSFQELTHQENSSNLLHLHNSGAYHVLYMLFNLSNCHNIKLIHHVLYEDHTNNCKQALQSRLHKEPL